MTRALPLALLALVAGAAGFFIYLKLFTQAPPETQPATAARQAAEFAPAFTLPDLEGVPRASTEWDGSVRVVNFWATWCPPCIREIPLLVDVQDRFGDRGVQVIGIAIDETEAVAEFAADFDFNYPVLIGQQDAMDLANTFVNNFIGLPFTAFTDREGRILRVHTGEIHREQIEAILAELL